MPQPAQQPDRALDFLKIWQTVFARNLEYIVEHLHDDDELDPVSIKDFNSCQMGAWINRQEDEIRSLKTYAELDKVHRRFHVTAGEVASLHKSHNNEEAKELLHGSFSALLDDCCLAIESLSKELELLSIYPQRFKREEQTKRQTIWSESLEIGNPEIDRSHHAIATLIDEVLVNGDIRSSSSEAIRFVGALKKLLRNDISAEVKLFESLDTWSEETVNHVAAHDKILGYLDEIVAQTNAGVAFSFAEVGQYLAEWYIDHLITYDLELDRFGNHNSVSN